MTDTTTEMQETEALAEVEVESSPAIESELEENTEVDVQANEPDWVKARVDKITAQKYVEKARADVEKSRADKAEGERLRLERELESLRSQAQVGTQTAIPQAKAAVAPPPHDLQYDDPDEYQRQQYLYNEHLIEKVISQREASAKEAERERQAYQEQATVQQKRYVSIEASARASGIDFVEVDKSAGVLVSQGANPVLLEIIADHPQSASLIDYLAKNPSDFDEINAIDSVYSILSQLNTLSPKALKRNISKAPDPVTGLKGLPARESDEFTKRCPGAVFK